MQCRDSKMDNTIKHEGIVERIENGIAYVKIIQHSACSGCHVKAACTIADQQEKIIETVCSGCNIKIGERVFIVGNETMSRKALKLAIIYPYYTVLYFRKSKLRKDFIFTLEKE